MFVLVLAGTLLGCGYAVMKDSGESCEAQTHVIAEGMSRTLSASQ